jgi:chitinase
MKRITVSALFAVLAGFLFVFGLRTGRVTEAGRPAAFPGRGRIVIGYFPSWNRAVFDHTMIGYDHLTHIANAFAWPDTEGNLVLPEGYLYPELNREAHRNGTKVLMSLGGWGNCAGFAPMAADPVKRAEFIGRTVAFCRDHDYDGVDVDWEFVETAATSADFSLFIKELSASLKAMTPPRQLTMAAPADDYYGRWIDFETLHPYFDFISFMTYDYHGPWSDHSGHNAPLYSCGDACGSMDETFIYALNRGIPLSKILLGIPFYGRSFDCSSLYQAFQSSEYLSFTEVMGRLAAGWLSVRDPCARVPVLQKPGGGEIVSYEDVVSIRSKCRYLVANNVAGLIIWEISQDRWEGESVLLNAIGHFFKHRKPFLGSTETKESPNDSQ